MKRIETTSASLHLMAMLFMLCDHLWGTVIPGNDWLTCIGRLAFPIFAFLLVEGYFHTSNLKRYALRLLLFALISEIPFDLAIGGRVFYPLHQNVLWSFLLSLGLVHWNEQAKQSGKPLRMGLTFCATLALGSVLGLVTFVDYFHAGLLTVLSFWLFRGEKWYHRLGQLLCLGYINLEILGGLVYEFPLFGTTVTVHQQGFALLALIPIWLYRGKRGHHSKAFQYLCYGFYPAHLLILGLIKVL